MNGELVRRLEPAAYRGGGALFVDEAALRRALKFGSDGGCECDLVVDCPLEGLWVEARSATRVLGTLKQQLDPAAVRRLDDIAPLAARFTLKATVQQEKFRLTGLLTPLFGTSRSAWKRSGVSLRARLTHELNTLAGHGELHRPHTSVEIRSHSIAFEISFQFRLPWLQRLRHEWSSPLNIADQVAASLDQLFGVHLGRLTGCAAGDLLGDVGPFLHRAKSNVMGIQAGHRGRLAVSAAIRQEARNAASAIRRPPEENVVTSDLGEIFAASAAGQKVSAPCPEILRYARIAMPREHVRLVFDTVFANACKALAASHSLAPVVEAASSKDRLVVTVSTPFRSDYRKGEGQGITGVEGWAEP
jgi:hypothetical protein